MLSPLFCLLVTYVGVDLGTEYIKAAESTVMGEPKMRFSPSGGFFRAAASVRKPQYIENYNSSINPNEAELRFGENAVKLLKAHPNQGYAYLPRVIGRGNTSFRTFSLLSAQEMMALYLQEFESAFSPSSEMIVAIPSYWTTQMRRELSSTFRSAGVKLDNIVDDKIAVAAHYAAINYRRFQNSTRNVLFVDVGATSAKAYGFIFEYDGEFSYANETTYMWSEQTGSYFFARDIAKEYNISMKKANKLFQEMPAEQFFDNVTNATTNLVSIIADAIESFSSLIESKEFPGNSGVIDEVQVFGGASRADIITKIIKKCTNFSKLYYEFNQNEAIAKGIIYLRGMVDGSIPVPPCSINDIPPSTLILATDNESYYYCQKGIDCFSPLQIPNSTNTTSLRVYVAREDLPEGATPLQFICMLDNLTSFNYTDGPNVSVFGEIFLRAPSPEINGIRWCANNTCDPIAATKYSVPVTDRPKQVNFTIAKLELNKDKKLKLTEYRRVEEIISEIQSSINNVLESKRLNINDIPANLLYTLKYYVQMLENGSLIERSVEELRDAQTDLKMNAKYIIESINKIAPKKSKKAPKLNNEDIFNNLKDDLEEDL